MIAAEHPARQATEAAIARVDAAADPDWKERALRAVWLAAAYWTDFTADAVWKYVEKPREPRALGPVMRRAVKLGYIEATGEYRPSEIPVHHSTPLRVYKRPAYRRPANV